MTEELRRIAPPGTWTFLSFEAFSTRDLVMVVAAEEAPNWKPGETRNCVFVKQEESEKCTVLVCKPRPKTEESGLDDHLSTTY